LTQEILIAVCLPNGLLDGFAWQFADVNGGHGSVVDVVGSVASPGVGLGIRMGDGLAGQLT
jgi:hypothetical protein